MIRASCQPPDRCSWQQPRPRAQTSGARGIPAIAERERLLCGHRCRAHGVEMHEDRPVIAHDDGVRRHSHVGLDGSILTRTITHDESQIEVPPGDDRGRRPGPRDGPSVRERIASSRRHQPAIALTDPPTIIRIRRRSRRRSYRHIEHRRNGLFSARVEDEVREEPVPTRR